MINEAYQWSWFAIRRRNVAGPRLQRLASRTISRSSFLHSAKSIKPSKASITKSKRQLLEYKTPSRRPTPASQHPQDFPRPNPLRYRTIPIILGGLTLAALTGYSTYLYISLTREPTTPLRAASLSAQQDVSKRYDVIARKFDNEVSTTESTMGIMSLRKKMVAEARGDVLEVSIGTGRNLGFYDWDFKGFNGVGLVDNKGSIKKGKVRSFTAIDLSTEMLEIAHEKFSTMFPGIIGVRWIIGDASAKGSIPGPPKSANERSGSLVGKKYDTVIQTFGLCSVADPVALLRNLGECAQEDHGRILLLEHGRGNWQWLNGFLDKSAEAHAEQFGCWWNRDLKAIVMESGLEVVEIKQPKWWHGGTTWWIELKKPRYTEHGSEMPRQRGLRTPGNEVGSDGETQDQTQCGSA